MALVFFTFKDSLFIFSHSVTFFNSISMFSISICPAIVPSDNSLVTPGQPDQGPVAHPKSTNERPKTVDHSVVRTPTTAEQDNLTVTIVSTHDPGDRISNSGVARGGQGGHGPPNFW